MIKAIFFDIGNVLCQEGFKRGIKLYEKEFNIPEGEFYKIIHDFKGWKDFTLGKISSKKYLKMCKVRCLDYYFDGGKYFELVKKLNKPNEELINYIKNKLANKYIIGIISNHPKDWYDSFIKKADLGDVIRINAISSYLHIRKPDERIFRIALNQADVKASESIYVDDRLDMVDDAKELGMNIIIFDVDNLKKEIKYKSLIKK